jgi:hypothetical protein
MLVLTNDRLPVGLPERGNQTKKIHHEGYCRIAASRVNVLETAEGAALVGRLR